MKRRLKLFAVLLVGLVVFALFVFVRVGGDQVAQANVNPEVKRMDLSRFSAEPPGAPLDLVFLHHSIGGQLLASPAEDPARGGGLRSLLEANRYVVHEATYGSKLGEHTDLFDWFPKFRDHMGEVLAIEHQDRALPAGTRNRIVMFKSCYPNNEFTGEGAEPGDPAGPELTLANARATLTALLGAFAKHPDVLFVYVTAPPLAPVAWPEPLWKAGMRKVLGRPSNAEKLAHAGALAQKFNRWVVSPDGWLSGYAANNVVVFDLFNVLTEGGSHLRYPTGNGRDSHPDREGNSKVAAALVPFLNRSVRRAGLSP